MAHHFVSFKTLQYKYRIYLNNYLSCLIYNLTTTTFFNKSSTECVHFMIKTYECLHLLYKLLNLSLWKLLKIIIIFPFLLCTCKKDTSKYLLNINVIHKTLFYHHRALESFVIKCPIYSFHLLFHTLLRRWQKTELLSFYCFSQQSLFPTFF